MYESPPVPFGLGLGLGLELGLGLGLGLGLLGFGCISHYQNHISHDG